MCIRDSDKAEALATLDPLDDLAPWLRERWTATYGADATRDMAAILASEPPLDLTVKSDPEGWAARLGGFVTPTGSVRLKAEGAIPELAGYADGTWSVSYTQLDVYKRQPRRWTGTPRLISTR